MAAWLRRSSWAGGRRACRGRCPHSGRLGCHRARAGAGLPERQAGQIAVLTDAGFATLEAAATGHVAEVRKLIFDHLTNDDVTRPREITAKILPGLAS